jgi:hypothetical protein
LIELAALMLSLFSLPVGINIPVLQNQPEHPTSFKHQKPKMNEKFSDGAK